MAVVNTIDYVQISTTGNASDFGDLTGSRQSSCSAASSVWCCFMGGYDALGGDNISNIIDYVSFSTLGNATDWGDLLSGIMGCSSCGGNNVYGFYAGGDVGSATNVIQYIDLATKGNSADWGDLTLARSYTANLSSPTRTICGGGGT